MSGSWITLIIVKDMEKEKEELPLFLCHGIISPMLIMFNPFSGLKTTDM